METGNNENPESVSAYLGECLPQPDGKAGSDRPPVNKPPIILYDDEDDDSDVGEKESMSSYYEEEDQDDCDEDAVSTPDALNDSVCQKRPRISQNRKRQHFIDRPESKTPSVYDRAYHAALRLSVFEPRYTKKYLTEFPFLAEVPRACLTHPPKEAVPIMANINHPVAHYALPVFYWDPIHQFNLKKGFVTGFTVKTWAFLLVYSLPSNIVLVSAVYRDANEKTHLAHSRKWMQEYLPQTLSITFRFL